METNMARIKKVIAGVLRLTLVVLLVCYPVRVEGAEPIWRALYREKIKEIAAQTSYSVIDNQFVEATGKYVSTIGALIYFDDFNSIFEPIRLLAQEGYAHFDDANIDKFLDGFPASGENEPIQPSPINALPTSSKVLINGKEYVFGAYLINGYNYFKLRDLAYVLYGTQKQFDVGYNDLNNTIALTSKKGYTVTGGEMTQGGTQAKTSVPTTSSIYLDGNEVNLTSYNIDGSNYFKLRDIALLIDFGVDYDSVKNVVSINTSKGYAVDVPITESSEYDAVIDFYRDMERERLRNEQGTLFNADITGLTENFSGYLQLNDGKRYCLDSSIAQLPPGNLGYAIHDMNSDGIPELIILSDDYSVSAIFTLHSNMPVLLDAYWSRYRCSIDKSGTLYTDGSNSAFESEYAAYLLPSGGKELQLIEEGGIESDRNTPTNQATQLRYYVIKDESKTYITEDEFDARFRPYYPYNPIINIDMEFIPLLGTSD